MLDNLDLFDPVFGWINLIVTLRIGIYHDQLHFDDVVKQASVLKQQGTRAPSVSQKLWDNSMSCPTAEPYYQQL